jgi:hypothetical protein
MVLPEANASIGLPDMETPAQTCARLVAALEDLVAREAATLEARDFTAVVEIQGRCAPLVELLGAHAAEVTDAALRQRIRALLDRRQQSGEWLSEQIEKTREALADANEGRRRIRQIAPVYGRIPALAPASRQLSAVG